MFIFMVKNKNSQNHGSMPKNNRITQYQFLSLIYGIGYITIWVSSYS